jgi:hypothetical protein
MAINPAAHSSEIQRLGCVLLDVNLKTVTSGRQLLSSLRAVYGKRLDRQHDDRLHLPNETIFQTKER